MERQCFVIVNHGVRQSALACVKHIRFDKKHMARGPAGALSSVLGITLACPDFPGSA
jgi:hypothetical protein